MEAEEKKSPELNQQDKLDKQSDKPAEQNTQKANDQATINSVQDQQQQDQKKQTQESVNLQQQNEQNQSNKKNEDVADNTFKTEPQNIENSQVKSKETVNSSIQKQQNQGQKKSEHSVFEENKSKKSKHSSQSQQITQSELLTDQKLSNQQQQQNQEQDLGIILHQTKKQRKNVEVESHVLANRIALLKQEELKSWKKIQETKKKTDDIFYLKKRNEDFIKMKQSQKLDNSEGLIAQKQENIQLRQEKKTRKENILNSIVQFRTNNYKNIKSQQIKNEEYKNQLIQDIINQNKLKSTQIRHGQVQSLLKIQDFKVKQKKTVQSYYLNEIDQQSNYKQQKEEEIQEMEKLELELIKKLHNTQLIQKSAFEELEQALNMPAQEFQQKYRQEKKNKKNDNQLQSSEKLEKNNIGFNQTARQTTTKLPKIRKQKKRKKSPVFSQPEMIF